MFAPHPLIIKPLNMKTSFFALGLSLLLFAGCQKASLEPSLDSINSTSASGVLSTTAVGTTYTVALESKVKNADGTFTWTWSVQNPNPGTGLAGTNTVQNLSHWNITLGTCATFTDITGGATSTDGINWVLFTPTFQNDPSQTCFLDPVVKFDVGTEGTAKTYYQLTITKDLETANDVTAVYKSGKNTACGVFNFPGFGCPPVAVTSCSMSQGYWFAKPNNTWGTSVKIGGKTYTQTEGQAIWKASNKGGLADSKAGFTQVAAIKLSGSTVHPSSSVWQDVAIVEAWLNTLNKLSPTYLPSNNSAAKAAAGRIGNWIDANHCQ
jgi:hypothetical protein